MATSAGFAATPESVERLLAATKIEQMVILDQNPLDELIKGTLASAVRPDVPAAEAKLFIETHSRKISATLKSEFSWEKIKPACIKICTEIFTQEEIDAQIAFYDTPIGKSIAHKLPSLNERWMALAQGQLASFMPRVEQLLRESCEQAPKPVEAKAK